MKNQDIKFRQAIFIDGKFHHWHYWGFVKDNKFVGPTNLKDPNFQGILRGKDNVLIYEGDGVRFENEAGCYLVLMQWYEGEEERCWAGFEGKTIRDITEDIYNDNGHAPESWTGEEEVVGNIIENPELFVASASPADKEEGK